MIEVIKDMTVDDKNLIAICATLIALFSFFLTKDVELAKMVVTGLFGMAIGKRM